MTDDGWNHDTDVILNTEIIVAGDNRYENKLEVNMIGVDPISTTDRVQRRWYMPDKQSGKQTVALLDKIARKTGENFTSVMNNALMDGFSIFNYRFGEGLVVLIHREQAALDTDDVDYYEVRSLYTITVSLKGAVGYAHADPITNAEILRYSGLLNIDKQQFTTILMLYGLCHSQNIPEHLKVWYQTHTTKFERLLTMMLEALHIEFEVRDENEDSSG
jgi:hypothetical protein